MDGRAFLVPARDLAAGRTESHWRSATGRAYYALLHEARSALDRWGFRLPPRESVHTFVRLKLNFAKEPALQDIGRVLDFLAKLRNQADYELTRPGAFSNSHRAAQAIADAAAKIAELDQIDSEPARRSAAIAALS